ncbi:MAG: hypothetical protein Q7R41_13915 [Phycisphaerales bacterium]|nr:hypothetical protein [Phycisphaerales bacterium]
MPHRTAAAHPSSFLVVHRIIVFSVLASETEIPCAPMYSIELNRQVCGGKPAARSGFSATFDNRRYQSLEST